MNALTTTFYQLLSDNLAVRPGKTALVDPKRSVDYATLHAEVDRVAAYLAGQGIARGDRVIVHLRKSIEEVVAMLAVAKVGGVIVNVNAQWTLDQLGYVAEDCGAVMVLTDGRAAAAMAKAGFPARVRRALALELKKDAEGFDDWRDLPEATAREVPVLDTDLAMIIYTSGSTGRPKGVMLSHRNIIAGARSVARYLRLSEDDRLISILVYSFDAGLNQLTTMLLLGGTVVHQPVMMPAEIVRTMVRHEVTGLAGVPPLINPIVRFLRDNPVALPSLRRVTNTGGRIPPDILDLMPGVFPGADIYLMYGLTESFRSTFLAPELFQAKKGSIGKAIPGAEVFVIKEGVGIAGPGEQGELVHRGPLVSMGYWGRPDLTNEKIRTCPELRHLIGDEKVVYSGDIVRVDEDGDLWFIGRNDAMIKTSGFRTSPDEIEDHIYSSGIVAEAVAYGVEDGDLGHAVHVAVTPLEGYDKDRLIEHCFRTMPSYMVPKQIRLWTAAMPRTASGKLARPEIVRISRSQQD
ncbi:AMP-binding protein [Albidovulum sediminicola]|uniref:AMP-binding protein n=1 Tax=Albidovulum sediminicola TaxID=2984331 RepID=A0ABT2Z5P5_9RHOB|nr:AMP-binding protein [Defluviimonas sp. WL0075]MCV2866474.1 AMP-binding protein [Defluviimonas sp. WL0075]